MQCCPADRGTFQQYRFQLRNGCDGPGATYLKRDVLQGGLGLLGREFEGDGPAWDLRSGSQLFPLFVIVDLQHHAVAIEANLTPLGLVLVTVFVNIINGFTEPKMPILRKPQFFKPTETFLLRAKRKFAGRKNVVEKDMKRFLR